MLFRSPLWNIEKVRSGKPNKWNYVDGCMITACLSLYKTTGDEKYLKFSRDFIDWFVQEDGSIRGAGRRGPQFIKNLLPFGAGCTKTKPVRSYLLLYHPAAA